MRDVDKQSMANNNDGKEEEEILYLNYRIQVIKHGLLTMQS